MVYQDPYTSLNPRIRIGTAVAEPALVHGLIETRRGGAHTPPSCSSGSGSGAQMTRRFPHEFSGGQRQRVAIARSLAVQPKLLIADEAVSALDVSIQAQLLSLLEEIRRDLGLTMIFIAHQLAVISRLAEPGRDHVPGAVVETGATADVFANPRHPYTRGAARGPPARSTASGVPQAGGPHRHPVAVLDIPAGCRFHTRCALSPRTAARGRSAARGCRTGPHRPLSRPPVHAGGASRLGVVPRRRRRGRRAASTR